jgi:hypothetical protein
MELLLTKKELLGMIEAINAAANTETIHRFLLFKGVNGDITIECIAGQGKVSISVPQKYPDVIVRK